MEPESSQAQKKQQAQIETQEVFSERWETLLFCCDGTRAVTQAAERGYEVSIVWRFSTVIWAWFWAISSRWPCWRRSLNQVVSGGHFKRFCDSVKGCETEQSLTMLVSSTSKNPVTTKPGNSR